MQLESDDHLHDCPVQTYGGQNTQNTTPTLVIGAQLWFFGTGNSVSGYASSTTVTAQGASGGTYNWGITSGNGAVSFSSSSIVTTATTHVNSVTIYASGYSSALNDVVIVLTWTMPDGVVMYGTQVSTQVDAPYSQGTGPNDPVATPSVCGANNDGLGYNDTYNYTLASKFEGPLPNFPVNETFGAETRYDNANWPFPGETAGYTNSDARYTDTLGACSDGSTYTPATGFGDGNTLVLTVIPQTWRAGSVTIGSGISVQTDQMNYYTDHGVLTSIVSPTR